MINIKIIITFLVLLVIGYLSYKYTEKFTITPSDTPPSATPSATQAPLITLDPVISAKLLEDATGINELSDYINTYNVESATPFFNNSILKPNFDKLLKKNIEFNKDIRNTTTLYTNSIDKYAKNINDTKLQIEHLMQKIATKDTFVDINSYENSEVNFENTNDYRAFREVYVN